MGLFGFGKKKEKNVVTEQTPEQKIAELKAKYEEITKKLFQTTRMISGYGLQIEKVVDNVKKNPENQFIAKQAKGQLTYLVAKKQILQKFSAMMEAVKSNLEMKIRELQLTGGKDIIDSNFINEISKIYGDCEEYFNMASESQNIESLEGVMQQFYDAYGQTLGVDPTNEVEALLKGATGQKEEAKQEQKAEAKKEGDVDINSLLDKVRKDL